MNDPRIKRTVLFICLLLGVPGVASAELSDGQLIRFDVSDARTGEVLYSGVERISVRDGQVRKRTVYRAAERGEVMVEEVSYDLATLQVHAFTSEHRESDERLSLRREGKRLVIEYVPRDGGATRRDEQLQWGPDTRLGKTLHHMIVRHWDEMVAGRTVDFDLLVPSKFDSYRFRLIEQPRSEAGDHVFRLEPQSWAVRQFVAPMDFHYDQERRAVSYEGPNTVDFSRDPDQRVVIRFSY